ncbi:MCE family protein [Streptomyces sp. NPDC090052]|uniref:MCE family protein n=1 Tax=unclassified Streptomyces TaxID=2593676 RepID=UPI002251CA73|nr:MULTISPECIES: MCE family protein [unclassified Streptomyces]MCX4722640.1 MCE family protein [Streptomyces sp. NBC_01306]WSV07716.1 MCE family protein [Streptomyces sp. NBC_01020]WSX45807.1 MCE family protein [Streptomyces sp. NBC_00963]WSX66120.1 MCE family protein [Streptomyces sp. NBC_00932]
MNAPRLRLPRLKPVRERNPVAVSVVGLLVLALIGLAAYRADSLPFIGGGTTYTADFTESAGIGPGDEVRIAGVRVGQVKAVALDGAKVKVTFKVKDAWVGNSSTAAIAIKTLLGDKYLALDPVGTGPQNPSDRIPLSRTTSPYDVTQAFSGLSDTIGDLDTKQLAKSFETISDTFKDSPPDVKNAATGLSALSRTVSQRDAELAKLLKGSKQLTKTLSDKNSSFDALLKDGNLLLGEIQNRRDSIRRLLTGTTDLGTELTGLVKDNNKQLKPTLTALDKVTAVLLKNRKSLDKALSLAGPYYRLVGNTLGNGRWFDSYICGLVPKNYLPAGTPPATGCVSPRQSQGSSR